MDLPEKVYISEDLTKKASEIYFHARKMVKTREIWSTFTMDDDVFVKASKEIKRQKINSIKELAYFTKPTSETSIIQQDSTESVDRERAELSITSS